MAERIRYISRRMARCCIMSNVYWVYTADSKKTLQHKSIYCNFFGWSFLGPLNLWESPMVVLVCLDCVCVLKMVVMEYWKARNNIVPISFIRISRSNPISLLRRELSEKVWKGRKDGLEGDDRVVWSYVLEQRKLPSQSYHLIHLLSVWYLTTALLVKKLVS